MGSRLLFSAIAALAVLGLSAEVRADDGGYRPKHHRSARHCCRYYFGRPIGGYLFGHQHTPWTFTDADNYPGYYNNQTFWERVQTQRNYPVQY